MQRQSHDYENQSDNDEGFIPSKIIIKEKKQFHARNDKNKPEVKNQFISRYITDGIMRKQPPQCYKRFGRFDFVEESINSQQQIDEEQLNAIGESQNNIQFSEAAQNLSSNKIKMKEKLLTPYDKYVASGDFFLVYSRYKDFKFTNQQPNFAGNEVKLDCLRSTEQLKFKPIKPFQIIQERRQSVITQQMNRNGSIRQSLLQFDSKFECGNLLCAFKHKRQPHTYTLFIQNDTNSYGYNQWFYFSVRNAEMRVKYKFHIVNFRKRNSFFRQGNRPVVFSLVDSRRPKLSGYSKRGENIRYGKSPIVKSYDSREKFYQLSYELEFYNEDDLCYISMGLPFSYSKLLNNLSLYEEIADKNGIKFDFESIGTSIAGNNVPYITITKMQDSQNSLQKGQNLLEPHQQSTQLILNQISQNSFTNRQNTQQENQKRQKRVIFIMGRQHPGQTWSSYLMDEFIHNLVSRKSAQCDYLLNNFIIKCIPMINVDGVISGNFRCDLSGMDLNRNWKTPSSLLHPQIFSIKNEIANLVNKGYKVQTCFDLHGHSKEYNVFCYSCKIDNVECRILPYIFSEMNQQFYFPFCTFGISRYKQSTARAVIFNIIKNTNVLTIESSFFGSKINGRTKVFEPQNFENMALTLLKGCKSYFSQDDQYQSCKQMVKLKMPEFLEYKGEKEDALSGSDSEPSADEMDLIQKLEKIVPKNLISQCIEAKSLKKPIKRTKKSLKRKTFQAADDKSFRLKNESVDSPSKNMTIDQVKQSPAKQSKSNWETIKLKKKNIIEHNRTSHFKKNSMFVSHQTMYETESSDLNKKINIRDIIDRQEQKLPFFNREKPPLIPMRLKNESFQIFKDAYNATEKYIKNSNQTSLDDVRNPRRQLSKKIGIFKEAKQKQIEEFPLLCVLSQNKKKTHVEKIKQRRQSQNTHFSKDQKGPQKTKTAIQTRTQAIKKLRQKDKNSMELVSKIWRQNFTRYGMAFSTFKISK